MATYTPLNYVSEDGLQLFARDYAQTGHPQGGERVVLCLHGLTRNSADFEPLCDILAPHYRLIVPDQRGRGQSQWDPDPEHYQPLIYNRDMLTLLDTLELQRVDIIGTSMGGIMGMMLAAEYPGRVNSLVLNDIGPTIDLEGVRLIATMVQQRPHYRDWEDAVSTIRRGIQPLFPDFSEQQWRDFARRTCRQVEEGVVPDYDPAIGKTFAGGGDAVAPDLWPLFRQLPPIPMLVIRGALSTLLSHHTCEQMQAQQPGLHLVELSNRGHAPILDEPAAVAAIEALLSAAQ